MSLFIGLMSGTSIDAINVALVEFTPQGLQLKATHTHLWHPELREELLYLSQNVREKTILQDIARLDIKTAELFAESVLTLLTKEQIPREHITALGSPGQTLYHSPNSVPPYTWQLGDPNVIAQLTGILTVADFRRRDVAAGGQGAPLATAFHNFVLRETTENRVVLNIGGIANITVLPADKHLPVIGFDTGPGNALLDAWAYQHLGTPIDREGTWASRGQVNTILLNKLLKDAYFRQSAPKTTGKDYFNLRWLADYMQGMSLQPQDVQATLCQLTIQSVVDAVAIYQPQRLLVCGGGVHNLWLMSGLKQSLTNCIVESTQTQGIDPDWVEAMCFAWLAKRRVEGNTGNLPSVTGAKQTVVLGGIYT